MKLGRTPPKPSAGTPPLIMRATPGEIRNGFDDVSIEKFFRSSMSPYEYWSEALRRTAEIERQCRERLAEFRAANPDDDDEMSVLDKKAMQVLQMDLEAALAAKGHAAEQLNGVA
jgi:hypothetical protein